ncbi:E3 ubiquitin-protein ligase TRIM36-like [Diadema setosum]|uniref:E3 ubiquitin-protein ligase TRIM36-like n=1 Tax=Diadema setosum TaxID=31175 RepID=UPI003B3B6277
MAAMNLDSVVSKEVECAICLERLDTPRILACLHSFCEKCLEKQFARSQKDDSRKVSLECALCKDCTEVPKSGVRGLRLDFRATRLVEALIDKEVREKKLVNSANKCETCGYVHTSEDVAEGNPCTYCRECCQILCHRCSSVHAGLRMTQNHTVASISDLLEGKVTFQSKDYSVLCPKHTDEKLKLFCVTCLEPICHDCTLIDHSRENYHELQFLKDFVPTIREKLSSRREDVAAKSDELAKFISLLDKLESLIVDHSKKTSNSIQCAVKEYKTRVDEFHHRLEREGCDYLEEKNKQLVELRRKTENMKALGDKSLLMTQQVLDNKDDLVGIASMYKSLLKAMDRTLAEKPDEQVLKRIEQSVEGFHFHVPPFEANVGKVIVGCSCRKRGTVSISCKSGPKDLQFMRDGRLAALVQDGMKDSSLCASIKVTATGIPGCSSFAWNRWLPTLQYEYGRIQYDRIRCFSALSGHRFVLATTGSKLHLLAENLTEISRALPAERSISGLATDCEDTIYASDKDHRRVFVLRADGSLQRTIQTGDLSPTGVAVSYKKPTCVVISHEPASASILDFNGNVLASIHDDEWKKAVVGCDVHGLVCVLWADENGQKTLQRFTFQGEKVETLFEKETHALKDLMLAVSPSGMFSAAVVTATGGDGKITTICHCDK